MEHGARSRNPLRHAAQGTRQKIVCYCLVSCALCLAPIINLQSKIYNLKSRVLLPKQSLDCLIDRLFS